MCKKLFVFLTSVLISTQAFLWAAGAEKFTGKTFVSSSYSIAGSDVTQLLSALGMELNMSVTFISDKRFSLTVSSAGETETVQGNYSVDPASMSLTLISDETDDPIVLTISDNYENLSFSVPMDEQNMVDVEFTESSVATLQKKQVSGNNIEIDYGVVKENIFKGNSYSLKSFKINGFDATTLADYAGGISASLTFTTATTVIFDMVFDGQHENDTGSYEINYAKNEFIFDGTQNDDGYAYYYNKGRFINFTVKQEGMVVDMIFERD